MLGKFSYYKKNNNFMSQNSVRKSLVKTNNIPYYRHWLKPLVFSQVWRKYGKRKKWLKKRRLIRRWRFNRKSAKVWKKAEFLNTYQLSVRRLKVLKDFNTRKILLDFLSWKLHTPKDRIRFLINRNFKRRYFAQDHVSNLLYNVLSRWDLILFYTGLVRNRTVCEKLIKRKGLIINGGVVANIFELQKVVRVGDSLEINYSRRTYFRRFWRKRNKFVWPKFFEYSKRVHAWVIYGKLDYSIIAKYTPQFLRFLAHPLAIERVLCRLRF